MIKKINNINKLDKHFIRILDGNKEEKIVYGIILNYKKQKSQNYIMGVHKMESSLTIGFIVNTENILEDLGSYYDYIGDKVNNEIYHYILNNDTAEVLDPVFVIRMIDGLKSSGLKINEEVYNYVREEIVNGVKNDDNYLKLREDFFIKMMEKL